MKHALTPLIGLTFLLAACNYDGQNGNGGTSISSASSSLSVASSNSSILTQATTKEQAANAVLIALQNENDTALSQLAHSDGVRFSPHTFVDTSTDIQLSSSQLIGAYADPAMRTWGSEAGSGEPIQLTFDQYADDYIWDHDYTQAPVVEWNQPADEGTITDNAAQVYPNAEIVKYHFTGFDPQYEGMDWSSLRLVLEEENGTWKLRGVIHDEWAP